MYTGSTTKLSEFNSIKKRHVVRKFRPIEKILKIIVMPHTYSPPGQLSNAPKISLIPRTDQKLFPDYQISLESCIPCTF